MDYKDKHKNLYSTYHILLFFYLIKSKESLRLNHTFHIILAVWSIKVGYKFFISIYSDPYVPSKSIVNFTSNENKCVRPFYHANFGNVIF